MTTTPVGIFDVEGPPDKVAITQEALYSPGNPTEELITGGRVVIRWGAIPNLPGTQSPAAGWTTFSPRLIRVRFNVKGAPNLDPEDEIYLLQHEIWGHMRLHDRPFRDGQKTACLDLLDVGPAIPPYADPDQVWRKVQGEANYWLRPYECIIDGMVRSMSGYSPYKAQYRRGVPRGLLPDLKQIWLQGDPVVPVPIPPTVEPPANPTPDPFQEVERLNDVIDSMGQLGAQIVALAAEEKE